MVENALEDVEIKHHTVIVVCLTRVNIVKGILICVSIYVRHCNDCKHHTKISFQKAAPYSHQKFLVFLSFIRF